MNHHRSGLLLATTGGVCCTNTAGSQAETIRKKKRNPKLRTSASAEAYMPILLDKLAELDAFDDCGRVIYPVVEDYVFRKCTDYRRYRDKNTGQIKEVGGNLTGKLISDALLDNNVIRLGPGEVDTRQRTRWLKRWEDTTPEMQAIAIQYGLKIEQKPHCQICFHIGQPLVEEAIAARQPLAAFILRRLRQKMPALLGDAEFGLWFFVEQVPYKDESLHAHGLLYINDDSWFPDNARKNERLRELIKKETGDDGRVEKNWFSMREIDMDAGNIWYQRSAAHISVTEHMLSHLHKSCLTQA